MEPVRTDYLFGNIDYKALATNYQCGHCNSETTVATDPDTGLPNIQIHHDDGCPVLAGTLSTAPDTLRALVGSIPDTFHP